MERKKRGGKKWREREKGEQERERDEESMRGGDLPASALRRAHVSPQKRK